MSLERKDVRAKLDPELHAALVEVCAIDGVDIATFVETLLVSVIRKRIHDAIALTQRIPDAGTSGQTRKLLLDQLNRRR